MVGRLLLLSALIGPLGSSASAHAAKAPQVPKNRREIVIDLLDGKLGAVPFKHAKHAEEYKRPDGTPIVCDNCHHTFDSTKRVKRQVMACSKCHVGLEQEPKTIGGKVAKPIATLKSDRAIDHRSILFHRYCRDMCHKGIKVEGRRLSTCKTCHERGIRKSVLHGAYDGDK